MCTYVEKAFKETQICRNSKNQKSRYKTQTILFQLIFNSIFIVFSFVLFQFYRSQSFWIFFNFFTDWCLKMAPRICNIRGLSSFLDLGGQVVHNAMRGPAVPSILPRSRWAIAHPAHPPLTPEYVTKKFTKEDMFAN
jgi:hypothetical protein